MIRIWQQGAAGSRRAHPPCHPLATCTRGRRRYFGKHRRHSRRWSENGLPPSANDQAQDGMVLLALPYRQTVVNFTIDGSHYTWYETDQNEDPSIGGGIYVKTLPIHTRSWWWCQRLNRWRRIQWTLEDVARSPRGPGWDVQWSWAYADAFECNE